MERDVRIFIQNLEFAILSIRNKIDVPAMIHFYEQELPRSFFEILQWDIDTSEKIELIVRVLELGHVTVKRGMNRYKSFVFYLPAVYTRITHLSPVTACQQAELLGHIVTVTKRSALKGNDVSLLLSHGVPTILDVFTSIDDMKSVMSLIAEKFETNANYPSLLLLKYSYDFLIANYDAQVTKISLTAFDSVAANQDIYQQCCKARQTTGSEDNQ